METILDIKNIETYYGNVMAIKGISIQVKEGQIVSILGGNGAGKTTILRSISGVLYDQPEKGTINFMGRMIQRMDAEKIQRLGISHVPEGREIFPELTTMENLKLGSYFRKDRNGVKRDLDKMLEHFPALKTRLNQDADTLSGGEQQMLAIARALMSRPKLILMDEPSMGLSPLLIHEIFRIIKEINSEGATILLVEQNANMALSVAHFAYVLETGRIVLFDETEKLKKNEDVIEFYLGVKEYSKVKSYKRKKKWS